MKILITGNLGYLGPVVAEHLRKVYPDARLIGVDTGYFADRAVAVEMATQLIDEQHTMDIRDIPAGFLEDIYAIVHLAAISNDPIAERYKEVTYAINHNASVALAEKAKLAGVEKFVFASSCSVYGRVEDGMANEDNVLNPLTTYAHSKALTEEALRRMADNGFWVTSLRFATACGVSKNLRLDLVLNDFITSAATRKEILILSDGSPLRPLIHVRDMARAIHWAIERDAGNGGPSLVVNTGRDDWNFSIKDLSYRVAEVVPGATVRINKDAQPDERSYSVSFERFKRMAPAFQPLEEMDAAIEELYGQICTLSLDGDDFRQSQYIRMVALEELRSKGFLDTNLRWIGYEGNRVFPKG